MSDEIGVGCMGALALLACIVGWIVCTTLQDDIKAKDTQICSLIYSDSAHTLRDTVLISVNHRCEIRFPPAQHVIPQADSK